MKKIQLTLLVMFYFYCLNLNGQINVDCNTSNVGIGNTGLLARFNIQPQLSEPGATNLLIGNYYTSTEGSMSLGVHNNYAWMQTWNNKPLYINSKGNDVLFFHDARWGKVGINEPAPSSALHVYGSIYASGTITSSDIRLKKNPNRLILKKDLMSKIRQLEPISYDWNDELINRANQLNNGIGKIDKDFFNRMQYGFSAQDVQKIFPELVYEDNNGTLGINYQGFIPMLFTVVDSLQRTVENLQTKMELMSSTIQTLENNKLKNASLGLNPNDQQFTKNILYQNAPNPFVQSTKIEYFLADGSTNAMICIYNMNGTQLKCIKLNQAGNGSITIDSGELVAGIYFYTLIVNGNVIDTKRMILTD